MEMLDKIYSYMQKFWNKDPKATNLVDIIKGTSSYQYLTIKEGQLYIHNIPFNPGRTSEMITYDLLSYTLGDIISELRGQGFITTSVPASEANKLAVLLIEVENLNVETLKTLQIANANNFKIFYPIAILLRKFKLDTKLAVKQLAISSASGAWLDYWGTFIGNKRNTGETDNLYVRRLLMFISNPQINNIAMEEHLRLLTGSKVIVKDVEPLLMEIQPSPDSYLKKSDIIKLVNSIKGYGISYILNYQEIMTDDYKKYYLDTYGAEFSNSDIAEWYETKLDRTYGFMFNVSIMNNTSAFIGIGFKEQITI